MCPCPGCLLGLLDFVFPLVARIPAYAVAMVTATAFSLAGAVPAAQSLVPTPAATVGIVASNVASGQSTVATHVADATNTVTATMPSTASDAIRTAASEPGEIDRARHDVAINGVDVAAVNGLIDAAANGTLVQAPAR